MAKAADVESGTGGSRSSMAKGSSITVAIVSYALCSSSMLLINKVAVNSLPAPSFVLMCQLLAASVVAYGMGKARVVEVDALEVDKVKAFLPAALSFLAVIYTNIKVIQYANVETFIVFRCSTPLIMSVSDYLFLNRELPTTRSWSCLVAILFSAVGYVWSDSDFQVKAYLWIVAWYGVFIFEMTYLKHLCDTVEMSNWGRVFYNNFIALFPLFIIGLASQEGNTVSNVVWNTEAIASLILSCLVGIGMSFTSFWLRSSVSATAFTVIGIMCKLGSVVLNYLYWDKHASAIGIGFLTISLFAGSFYRQAPLRSAEKLIPTSR